MDSSRVSFDSAIDVTDDSDAELDHFPFFKLPAELRIRVYESLFKLPNGYVVDLDPLNYRRLAPLFLPVFLTSKRMHSEASEVFYGSNKFRVFATTARFVNTKKQLLSRLPPYYRNEITSMELRLGPGWHKPPRGWVVDDALGLHDLKKLRRLDVFVELDPAGDAVFEGFRQTSSFYTDFSLGLLRSILAGVPTIVDIELDCWLSVRKDSPLMKALRREAKHAGKRVMWGREIQQLEEFEEMISRISSLASLTDAVAMPQMADGLGTPAAVVYQRVFSEALEVA